MTLGLLGRKVGMTQIFAADGTSVPVTVVAIEPNTVTKLRTPEQDGYSAVQLGIEAGKRRLNKPDLGQFKGELPACSVVREFRVDSLEGMAIGQALDVSLFAEGDLVDVVGVSKGKGFAGTIKRHSFSRGPETHGADHHREPGSIGAGTTPGRVYRGTRMAGHMGVDRVTMQKMKIVRSDGERNLLLIKGSVPGAKNALVAVSKAEQI
ncbi:MAG: 50S ribosomal protein L3 [Chloroflexi bacterium]|jgi:large subunit ribosomal protein L3|nr:MAG: 50S ribosomal protein L3 [Chloroflexota bacterium]